MVKDSGLKDDEESIKAQESDRFPSAATRRRKISRKNQDAGSTVCEKLRSGTERSLRDRRRTDVRHFADYESARSGRKGISSGC
jgi:hypothetical protein